jgi:hypothetical protein
MRPGVVSARSSIRAMANRTATTMACPSQSAAGRPADDTGYRGADGDCGFKTDFLPHYLASVRAPVESVVRRRKGNGREIRARRRVRHGWRSSPRAVCGSSACPRCSWGSRVGGTSGGLLAGVARVLVGLLPKHPLTAVGHALGCMPIAHRNRTFAAARLVSWPMCVSAEPLPSPASHISSSA